MSFSSSSRILDPGVRLQRSDQPGTGYYHIGTKELTAITGSLSNRKKKEEARSVPSRQEKTCCINRNSTNNFRDKLSALFYGFPIDSKHREKEYVIPYRKMSSI